MDRFTEFTARKLNLTPKTDEELSHVLNRFERKWQVKARRIHGDRPAPRH